MCVIVYKPKGKKLPNTDILKRCFEHNKDGAGYMLPINNKVVIRKGFMTFDDFKEDIEKTFRDNKIDVYNTPVVLHFRIGTQGANSAELCHPYPLCDNYEDMRKTRNECDFALAHNGIISRCSVSRYGYGHWDKKLKKWVDNKIVIDYNDTMTFIKDFANKIIDNDIDFAKRKNKVELLEELCEYGKLAIMNRKGYVKLIGQFYQRKGIFYSNLHHEEKPITVWHSQISSQPFTSTEDLRKYGLLDVEDDW